MKKITDTVTFRHGAKLANRVVMAPMVTFSGNEDGTATDKQIAYYQARSKIGGMIITETMYINEQGEAFKGELGIADDKHIDGLKRLVNVIKKDGAKVICQLHHGGREAGTYFDHGGTPVAPSNIDFPFLDYPIREMTHSEILKTIKEYGDATKRAIAAGFDGVEIHGANHYLIQQFFSAYSNHRTDEFGGSLDARMLFAKDVIEEVLQVVKDNAPKDFIIGIRMSQEEVHGNNVGFDYKDNIKFIPNCKNKLATQ